MSGLDEWIRVHGHSEMCSIPCFSPWRVCPDLLHIVDATIAADCIASFLIDYAEQMGQGRGREPVLTDLYAEYRAWCESVQVKSAEQCSPKLFTSKVLKSDTLSYPAVTQKHLKAVPARMMLYWVCAVAHRMHAKIGADRTRLELL